jgi:4-amino-4-deoxy-L-arabinose transferase-like glycosyltransferase
MQDHVDTSRAAVSSDDPNAGSRGRDLSARLLLVAMVAFFVARIPVIPTRAFDPDELEHAHAAFSVFGGLLPYKDFFEHHTPWYHYLLQPLFHLFDVAGSFESARNFLIAGRVLSLALTVVSVAIVVAMGRRWLGRRAGLLAGLFLVGQPVFFEKTVEIRPDVLALPFYLAGLWFVQRGLAPEADGNDATDRKSRWSLWVGGLAIGAAIMCTQKMLFVLPGLAVGFVLWGALALRQDARTRLKSRVLATGGLGLALFVPGLLTVAAFSLRGGGAAFIRNNFLLNAGWKHVVIDQLRKTLASSAPILILALLGVTVALYRYLRGRDRQFAPVVWASILGFLIAGILVVPVAHRQYYLMLLPLVCLFAAQGLVFLVGMVRAARRGTWLAVAVLGLSVLPTIDVVQALRQRNDKQLARLRYVYANTRPTDTVMDGWEGTGVFRPHAFYYYFIHEELLDMLPKSRVDALVDDMEAGRITPRLIALDQNLIALGSRFVRFVERNYRTDDGFFMLPATGKGQGESP